MLRISLKSIVSSVSAVFLVAALGTHAFGDSNTCRDLRTEIEALKLALGVVDGKVDQSNASSSAIRLALGVVDGKVDQSNESSAAIRLALGVLDGKVDQSNESSSAIRLALGVVDGKIDQSNAGLAIVQGELQRIREALLAQAPVDEGLQLQVEVDAMSCASGATQCEFAIQPSSLNQIPIELKLLVLRDQTPVMNLGIDNFSMTGAFLPGRGPGITVCADGETGCGSPEFFINRENGCYQLWVHPLADNWVSGTNSLLLRVTDTEGHVGTKLVLISVVAAPGSPLVPSPIADPPGTGIEQNKTLVNADN